jgi:hypothetical protein
MCRTIVCKAERFDTGGQFGAGVVVNDANVGTPCTRFSTKEQAISRNGLDNEGYPSSIFIRFNERF